MPFRPTLNALGLKHGTDKASSHHNYLEFYDIFFAPLRDAPLSILEVGVFNGASLATWKEYFPNARIVGADISPSAKRYETERVAIELLDQSNIQELTDAAIRHGPFDIVIEDGSHMWEHQTTSLRTLFPFVKNDGIYIVEDLQTNYGRLGPQYQGVASTTCVDYLKSWADLCVADAQTPIEQMEDAFLRTYGRAIQFITFHRHACLIRKRFQPELRDMPTGQPLAADRAGIVPLRITAHVSHKGDVSSPSGFVNLSTDNFIFQGFAIESDQPLLEYRARTQDGGWTDWSQGGFVGTRGQARTLSGFTIRLRQEARHRYTLRALGRFAGSPTPVVAGDGQDCIAPSGAALCGLQIDVTERGAKS